jgi:hypothetical protein
LEEAGDGTGGLTSYGIGLTKLRAIAKKVGRDHDLALGLWNERNHDAKIIGLLIDDPESLTREQIEKQVDGAGAGMLSHALSSCGATLPRSPLAFEVAKDWMVSRDRVRRSCGYGLVYELAKDKKDKRLTDEFFLGCIEKISKTNRQGGELGARGDGRSAHGNRKAEQEAQRSGDQGCKGDRPDPLQRRRQEVRADGRAGAPDQRLFAERA